MRLCHPFSSIQSKQGGTPTMNAERLRDSELMEQPIDSGALVPPVPATALVPVPESARQLLLRMFADPYVLEQRERAELVAQLRECVSAHPEVAEVRVLLGMALCVNLEVQEALEELGEGVRL